PEIYPLSLHDALPILGANVLNEPAPSLEGAVANLPRHLHPGYSPVQITTALPNCRQDTKGAIDASDAQLLTRFLASSSACSDEKWLLSSGGGRADLHQVQAAGAELGGAAYEIELPHAE